MALVLEEEVEDAPGMGTEVVNPPPRAMAAALKAAQLSGPASSVFMQL